LPWATAAEWISGATTWRRRYFGRTARAVDCARDDDGAAAKRSETRPHKSERTRWFSSMRRRLLAPRWTRTQFLNRALQRARATDTLVMSQPVFDEVCDVLHGAWL